MCNWFMQHYHTWTESVSQRFSKSAFFFFLEVAVKGEVDKGWGGGFRTGQRRHQGDPNPCAVTALWKYQLFFTATGAPPSDCSYLHSEESTRCRCKTHEVTAAACTDAFPFLSNTCCLEWNLFCIHFNINGWYTQIGFQRSMCLSDEPPPLSQAGFLHDLMNGTIELIWFSSLYKIPDKMQCLNTPSQSLVQHHHQLKPGLNIEGCPVCREAPLPVYLLGL